MFSGQLAKFLEMPKASALFSDTSERSSVRSPSFSSGSLKASVPGPVSLTYYSLNFAGWYSLSIGERKFAIPLNPSVFNQDPSIEKESSGKLPRKLLLTPERAQQLEAYLNFRWSKAVEGSTNLELSDPQKLIFDTLKFAKLIEDLKEFPKAKKLIISLARVMLGDPGEAHLEIQFPKDDLRWKPKLGRDPLKNLYRDPILAQNWLLGVQDLSCKIPKNSNFASCAHIILPLFVEKTQKYLADVLPAHLRRAWLTSEVERRASDLDRMLGTTTSSNILIPDATDPFVFTPAQFYMFDQAKLARVQQAQESFYACARLAAVVNKIFTFAKTHHLTVGRDIIANLETRIPTISKYPLSTNGDTALHLDRMELYFTVSQGRPILLAFSKDVTNTNSAGIALNLYSAVGVQVLCRLASSELALLAEFLEPAEVELSLIQNCKAMPLPLLEGPKASSLQALHAEDLAKIRFSPIHSWRVEDAARLNATEISTGNRPNIDTRIAIVEV